MEEELRKTFVELVKFVQQVGPDVWAIMVKQQIILGISIIILWMLACVGFVGSYKLLKRNGSSDVDLIVGVVGCVLCGVGVFCTTIMMFDSILPKLFNPEYYALMALKP